MSKSALSKILIGGNRNPRELGPQSKSAHEGSASEHPATPDGGRHRHASLYDDTLSNRSEWRWSSLIWGFVALIVVAGVVAVFLGSSADQQVLELAETKAKVADESELSKVVSEVRDRDATAASGEPSSTPDTAPQKVSTHDQTTPVRPPTRPATQQEIAAPPAGEAASTSKTPAVLTGETTKPPSPQPVTTAPAKENLAPSSTQDPTASAPAASAQETNPTQAKAKPGQVVEEEQAPAEEPAGPPPENKAAYDALIQDSQVAAKIVVGAFPTLTYQTWRVVQKNDREVWIDLIANWTDSGSEVHFIWAVSRDGKTVRALSEAARNLVREG